MNYLFAITLLGSAFLMFWLEPLIAKLVLPILGGVPSVWNTCMMFFQGGILAGYGYAYLSTRFFSIHIQILIHLLLMLLALAFLPITLHSFSLMSAVHHPIYWLLSFLIFAIGLPFVIISATSTLLQNWYGRLLIVNQDPYFLYSASNLGSMLALLAFPLLLEPHLTLHQQNIGWRNGFIILIFLMGSCAIPIWRNYKKATQQKIENPTSLIIPDNFLRLRWVLLAFVPSSLLLSVTMHLTTDVASIPLFWIIPLALYILSFILVFARRQIIPHKIVLTGQLLILMILLMLSVFAFDLRNGVLIGMQFFVYLSLLFFTAMVCHRELVIQRPRIDYLAEFYLWIALGGLLGGIFNVLIAPVIFNNFWELSLVLVLAVFLRPYEKHSIQRFIVFLGILVSVLLFIFLKYYDSHQKLFNILYIIGIILVFSQFYQRWIFTFGIAALLFIAAHMTATIAYQPIFQERNFFGIVKILDAENTRLLFDGNIIHGVQNLEPGKNREIKSYYSTLSSLFQYLGNDKKNLHVGVVGLGAGSLACYARPQDDFTFYEINPAIVKIAVGTQFFSYLSLCTPKAKIILGDARLSLQQAEPQQYDLLILDAFTSDAIPMHLLTIEAVQLYLQNLIPDGILLFNITNRYLDLAPLLQGIAGQLHLSIWEKINNVTDPHKLLFESNWIALTSSSKSNMILKKAGWHELANESHITVWRDDFSNILSAIK